MIPGEFLLQPDPIDINAGRPSVTIVVANRGDRPIQVGSHCHFLEVNAALVFDREKAYGMRLDIGAGTAVRFEPGDEREVELVAIGGDRIVHGLNGLVNGRLDDPDVREKAIAAAADFVAERQVRLKPDTPRR